MEVLLNQLGLEKIEELKHNVIKGKKTPVSGSAPFYILKLESTEQEVRLFRDAFPKVDQKKFGTLILPSAIKVGSLLINHGWWVLMNYYQGETVFWDETNPECVGGRNIGLEHIDTIVNLLKDLRLIETSIFAGILPTFNTASWYISLDQKLLELTNLGLFPQNHHQRAIDMLSSGLSDEQMKDLILTNGDFQFRNFIKLPSGKVAIVDWTENAYNTPNIEPIEFPIMYQWTLMWANSSWQNVYVKKAIDTFGISMERLSFALLIKSINQAHLWRGSPELARRQVEHSIRAIDGQII